MAAEINNHRRYCLLKAQFHATTFEFALRDGWLGKQLDIAGTALPVSVPHQDKLAAIHYATVEDLTGADTDELVAQGLSRAEAAAVLKALS